MNRYDGFHQGLRNWFVTLQSESPHFHVSCAGRGFEDQEEAYRRHASKAHFGQSSHNFNAAIDLFFIDDAGQAVWDLKEMKSIFKAEIGPRIKGWLRWYGDEKSPFYELWHVEVKDWRQMALDGELQLVEGFRGPNGHGTA